MRSVVLASVLVACAATEARAQQDRWWGRDKALHLTAGAALGAGGYALGTLVFDQRERRIVVGVSIGVLAGAAKEIRDRRAGGDPSWRDFAWTAAGTAAGVTAAWLINRSVQPADARPDRSRRQLSESAAF